MRSGLFLLLAFHEINRGCLYSVRNNWQALHSNMMLLVWWRRWWWWIFFWYKKGFCSHFFLNLWIHNFLIFLVVVLEHHYCYMAILNIKKNDKMRLFIHFISCLIFICCFFPFFRFQFLFFLVYLSFQSTFFSTFSTVLCTYFHFVYTDR